MGANAGRPPAPAHCIQYRTSGRRRKPISVPERDLAALGAARARAAIAAGEISAEELTRACLDRIQAREAVLGAWAHLDRDLALAEARRLDKARKSGAKLAPLHGLPVGIKDIFDTADMPTECGSALFAGRRPLEDSTAVALLRKAGAVILGKTVTTEMALSSPGKTTNPHDRKRTPGGSSSGSAAAVAAGMVPLAVASQTGGSTIRPASFCGIFGYKPTFGTISRRGMAVMARRLDTIGVYAREPEDLALIGDALMASDSGAWDMLEKPGRGLVKALRQKLKKAPRFAFVRTPAWQQGDDDMRHAFEAFIASFGARVREVALEGLFADVIQTHLTIFNANIAATLGEALEKTPDKLTDETKRRIKLGLPVTGGAYVRALALAEAQAEALDRLFDHYDALLTPAATGEAPVGLATTGKAVFNGLWTLLGVPAVTVPLLAGAHGLPIG
ncbi:MAG: amidase, partial [Candidatus Tectomicrobia bacterium]|nr:amidase [Candidatus Tectomicrobia bacterium]